MFGEVSTARLSIAGAVMVFAVLFAPSLAQATDPYPFGWSADQQPGSSVVAQYDYDWPTPAYSACLAQNPPPPGGCNPLKGESCNVNDGGPDDPVRAFRFKNANNEYRVQITLPKGAQNRRLIGTDLHSAKKESSPNSLSGERRLCGQDVTLSGNHGLPPSAQITPETYDNRAEWISGPYFVPDPSAPDGGKVHVLMHHEFKPATFTPGDDAFCSQDDLAFHGNNCWFSSVTYSRSDDLAACPAGGATPNTVGACYSHNAVQPPSHLVGTIPYQYYKDWGRNGYNAHTNVLKGEGENYYYFLTSVNACLLTGPPGQRVCDPAKNHQKAGVCVLRTNNVADPSSWMAWNGTSFGNRPSGAYPTPPANPANHTCEPVAGMQVWNLTYNRYLKKYMLLGHGTFTNPATGVGVRGAYYSLSEDFINWSDPQLVMKAPGINQEDVDCNLDGIGYPVLLDSTDPAASATGTQNPNFDHPGRTSDLYFRHNLRTPDACSFEEGSNLSRLPIQFNRQRQATFEDGSLRHEASGYDSADREAQGYIRVWPGSAYEGTYYTQALEVAGNVGNGTIDTKWREGDDVWYSSAFYMPGSVRSSNDKLKIMRWDDGPGNAYGGIALDSDDQYRIVRGRTGTGGSEDQIGFPFALPDDRWVWLEVHQRLSSDPAVAVSEVYVDGRLVTSSRDANMYSGGNISHVSFGFITPNTTNNAAWMNIDRSTVLGGQRGALGAPATPTGLRQTSSSSASITLSWNDVPVVTGYRIYERNPNTTDGNWMVVEDVPGWSTSWTGSPCYTSDYKVAAFTTTAGVTKDSILSSPVQAGRDNCS